MIMAYMQPLGKLVFCVVLPVDEETLTVLMFLVQYSLENKRGKDMTFHYEMWRLLSFSWESTGQKDVRDATGLHVSQSL